MKVDILNGYVIVKDTLTRKAQREYNNQLFHNAEMVNVTDGKSEFRLSPVQMDLAGEALVLNMIEKVVVTEGEKEREVTPDRDWLDELSDLDFKKIEKEVLRIKKEGDAKAKKL